MLQGICEERRAQRQTQRAMKRNASVAVSGIIVFGRDVQVDLEALSIENQDAAYRDVAEAIAARLNFCRLGLSPSISGKRELPCRWRQRCNEERVRCAIEGCKA